MKGFIEVTDTSRKLTSIKIENISSFFPKTENTIVRMLGSSNIEVKMTYDKFKELIEKAI